MKKIIEYDKNDQPRIDFLIKKLIPHLSRKEILSFIKEGKISVNGKVSAKGYKVKKGDILESDDIPLKKDSGLNPNPNIKLYKLYEDKDLIVLNKPRGMPTHPNKYSDIDTLANGIAAVYTNFIQAGPKRLEGGLLNRLDNDTSGIVLAAKNRKAYEIYKKLLSEGQILKEYIALVVGHPKFWGSIDSPIIHHPKNQKKMKVVPKDGSNEIKKLNAQTTFVTIRKFSEYTLLKVVVPKAVTHQIRVHLASIGNPLAGDKLYQDKKAKEADNLGLSGHFLHASKIKFLHPEFQKMIKVESSLPEELSEILAKLD
jgi:23S rRNA pseudouridine1911/1915/1917 synthase